MPKKRADGRYAKTVTVGKKEDGTPIRRTVYGKTIKELNENYHELTNTLHHGISYDADKVTVKDLAELWLKSEKVPNVKEQSLRCYENLIHVINRHLGNIRLPELTAWHIEGFRDRMIEDGTVATYNNALGVLRAMLNYGVRRDLLMRNVSLGMRAVRNPNKRIKRTLTPMERQAVENAPLNASQRAFVSLLLYTGMRRGEIFALTVSDIHLPEGYIDVHRTIVNTQEHVQNTPKTPAGNRRIPIAEPLVADLTPLLEDRHPFEPLFATSTLGFYSPNAIYKKWLAICDVIFGENVPGGFTPHLFRHTFASELYRAGVPLKAAQYILGHSDVKTTLDTYTHFEYADLDHQALQKAFDAVSAQSNSKARIAK